VIYPVALHVPETVMMLLAVYPPSSVVTVITAVPAATPVTTPAEDTVATPVSEELQETVLLVAFEGATVAIRVVLAPILVVTVEGVMPTPVTAIGMTVILHGAVKPPSAEVTVITAVPSEIPVTTPELLTVAMLLLELLQL